MATYRPPDERPGVKNDLFPNVVTIENRKTKCGDRQVEDTGVKASHCGVGTHGWRDGTMGDAEVARNRITGKGWSESSLTVNGITMRKDFWTNPLVSVAPTSAEYERRKQEYEIQFIPVTLDQLHYINLVGHTDVYSRYRMKTKDFVFFVRTN